MPIDQLMPKQIKITMSSMEKNQVDRLKQKWGVKTDAELIRMLMRDAGINDPTPLVKRARKSLKDLRKTIKEIEDLIKLTETRTHHGIFGDNKEVFEFDWEGLEEEIDTWLEEEQEKIQETIEEA